MTNRHCFLTRHRSVLCRSFVMAAVLLGFALPAAAQQAGAAPPNCDFPRGWWENPTLAPLFGGPTQPPQTDCDFQLWAWSAFAHFVQAQVDQDNKFHLDNQPMFLTLPTYNDLKPDGGRLSAVQAKALIHPRELMLLPRNDQPQSLGSFQQAGPFKGVLVDQNGRAVYYTTHMDQKFFDFTQQYFGPNNYKKASPTLDYPVGATVLKSSWRIVQPGEDTSNVFTTTATIALLKNNGKGELELSGKTQSGVKVALVGMHVVGVVPDHPEFVWATFEHVGNAPVLTVDPHSSSPVSQQSFTFYKGGTPANQSNVRYDSMSIDEATQAITPIANVFAQFEFGGAPPGGVLPIQQANANFQGHIKTAPEPKTVPARIPAIDSVFANYRLVGSVWQLPNSLKPGDGDMAQNAIGAIDLANSTLETFVQASGSNCFSCHRTTRGQTYPAKNINISHIITSKLESNPAVQRARGIDNPLPALPAPLPR